MSKSIELTDEKAREIYKDAPPAMKVLLEENFSKQVLKGDVMDRIKTFEDALEETGETLQSFSTRTSLLTPSKLALEKLEVIIAALNEDPKFPDWTNRNQAKWYIWWEVKDTGSGLGLSFGDDYYNFINTAVGSRLHFKSSALARYAASQFIEIFKQYLL